MAETQIIRKILADGKKRVETIISEANKKAEDLIQDAKLKEEEFLEIKTEEAKEENKQKLKKLKDSNLTEQNQLVLKTKNEILASIYDLVLQQLKALSTRDYEKFLTNILKNANKGDELIISSRKGEEGLIKKLDVFKAKKLKIQSISSNISGGVIIVSQNYDLDYSFENLVAQKYQNSYHKTAKLIF